MTSTHTHSSGSGDICKHLFTTSLNDAQTDCHHVVSQFFCLTKTTALFPEVTFALLGFVEFFVFTRQRLIVLLKPSSRELLLLLLLLLRCLGETSRLPLTYLLSFAHVRAQTREGIWSPTVFDIRTSHSISL